MPYRYVEFQNRNSRGLSLQVFSAVISKQATQLRDIEIINSFEIDYNKIEGEFVIDLDYFNTKEE